jgi:hypothetical protein
MSRKVRKGAALIMAMIFVILFASLAIGVATISDTNVQIASNQHRANLAFATAESGLEVMRYWLSRVLISSSLSPSEYRSAIISAVRNDLASNGISNVVVQTDGSIPSVIINSATGQTFAGQIQSHPSNPCILQVSATGVSDEFTRTIRVNYNIEPYNHPIFNYGLATKGPLDFPGNPTVTGANANWEADMYIESGSSLLAVHVGGNTNFDGDISVGNSGASVDFEQDVQIAGDYGQEAIDEHVSIGADQVDFPVPQTGRFQQYATGDVIDSSSDLTKGITITNGTIAAGTNPYFDGSVIIEGILYIEPPNIVTFGHNVELRGIIVAPGDVQNPGTNTITFLGNFATAPYPSGAEFDTIRHETGSSIIAPGFSATFAGNFSALDGVMGISGVHFSGNANAVIKGTIINYSDTPAVVEGNATLNFDRMYSTKIPSGFDTHRELNYDPSSYVVIQ